MLGRVLGFVIGSSVLLLAGHAAAATVTLAWNPNSETDLAGYKVYYGTTSTVYTGTEANEGPSPIDVPLTSLADITMPTLVLTGMTSCTVFYFAVTAYNTAAQESGFSAEVAADVVATPTSVMATSTAPGALHVTWVDPPADDPGMIPTYNVYYDTDSGMPYTGTDANEGPSPIAVPTSSLADPTMPSFDLTGLTPGQTYYLTVESACDNFATTKTSDEASGVPESSGTGGAGGATTSAGGSTSSATASGGATATTGVGTPGTGGGIAGSSDGAAADNTTDSGCSCRVGDDESDTTPSSLAMAALGALAWIARRRTTAGTSPRRALSHRRHAS